MDYFEKLPDEILLHIIDIVSDNINTLFRLRALSHRFNLLVIVKTKHLLLQADKFDKIFNTDLGSRRCCCPLAPTKKLLNQTVFLRCFNHVVKLVIELPKVNCLRPSAKHEVKCMFKGTFGKNLKNSCVILCYSTECYCEPNKDIYMDFKSPLWYVWRQIQDMLYLLNECASIAMKLVPHLENLVSLVVKDSKGDLEMVMDEEEIRECRETYDDARIVIMPAAQFSYRIRNNEDGCIDIGGGLAQGTMILGVGRVAAGRHHKKIDDAEEADLVRRAFGSGVHGIAIEKLLHSSLCLYEVGSE